MLHASILRKGKNLETQVSRAEMLQALKDKDALLWVDIESPTEFETECLVEVFNFHPLAVEDCLNDQSIPKMDDYEDYIFLVALGVRILPADKTEEGSVSELQTIELDMFLGPNYVVTFHKSFLNAVTSMREAVKRKTAHYMGHGADFLFHGILDHLVDHFQPVLDYYEEKIEKLEEEVCHFPDHHFLKGFLKVKQDLFNLKRIAAPMRDIVGSLTRHPTPLIRKKQIAYFRDIHDHSNRIYSIAESLHELLSSILQAYFSQSSQRLNEIMKRMTILATLSMPTIIIASLYGMNFQHMPELEWRYGYLFAVLWMAGTSAGMLIWMKQKKWI